MLKEAQATKIFWHKLLDAYDVNKPGQHSTIMISTIFKVKTMKAASWLWFQLGTTP